MRAPSWKNAVPLAAVAVAMFRPGAAPADDPEWPYDVVRLKNGSSIYGLILEESPTEIKFRVVHRKPGRPTFTFRQTFHPEEIAEVRRLDDGQREVLRGRLEALDETLKIGGVKAGDVDLICLTGGTAQVPHIRRSLEERFGAEKLAGSSAFHAVITGLAAANRHSC